jgi:hypothetical protein
MKIKPPQTTRVSQLPVEIELKGGIKKAGAVREKRPAPVSFEGQKELNVALLKYAKKKDWDIVEELLRRGAKPSERDIFLYNAATYAAEEGKTLVLALMVRQGLRFSINDGASRSAYIKAKAKGHEETAKFILRNSDFVDGQEKSRCTLGEMDAILEYIAENLLD